MSDVAVTPAVTETAPAVVDGKPVVDAAPVVTASDAAAEAAAAAQKVADEAKAADYELEPIDGGVLDEASVKEVATLAKKLGLSKDAATELLAAQDGKLRSFQDSQIAAFEARQVEWEDASKADPEIGGAKAVLADKNATALLKRFDADGSLTAELEATGFAKHPVVRRFLSRIGAAMSEDDNDQNIIPAAAPKSREQRMYPDHK